MTDLRVGEAAPGDAATVTELIHAAFGARPPLDPPSTASRETPATVGAVLRDHGGLLARVDGRPAGAMLFGADDGWLVLRRVSVHPQLQHRGVATAMVGCAEEVAAGRGATGVRIVARTELPETVAFWRRRGYVDLRRDGTELVLAKRLPLELTVATSDAMRELGCRLARLLAAGDLVLLSGELGAGKTTLTQGIGAGLGVRGPVTSPTFVIARRHPPVNGAGPALLHVDAYRLGGVPELDDLDLDSAGADAVTVVEWGEGLAEGLAADRLEIALSLVRGPADDGPPAAAADAPRAVRIVPVGRRWVLDERWPPLKS